VVGLRLKSILCSFFSSAVLGSRLTEIKPNFATCLEVRQIWKATSKIWSVPSPKTWGPNAVYFQVVLRRSIGANIFQTKHTKTNLKIKLRRVPKGSPSLLLWTRRQLVEFTAASHHRLHHHQQGHRFRGQGYNHRQLLRRRHTVRHRRPLSLLWKLILISRAFKSHDVCLM